MKKVFWTEGATVSQETFATPKTLLAPVQPHFAPLQEAFGSLRPKDLLHPPLTTFEDFPFSGSFLAVLMSLPLNSIPNT